MAKETDGAADRGVGGADHIGPRTGLFTDLYELTMVQSYLEHGKTGDAVFDLHVRSLPPGRGYMVAAGLASTLDALDRFSFADEDLAYLADQGLSDDLLDYLDGFSFTGTVRAVPEGRLVFPYEPLLQVEASLPEAQLVETLVLNRVHLGTTLATKAARVVHAAQGRGLVDFGARRAHGHDAARVAARSAYLAGFLGTSLVEAARALEVPCFGTMAHSYVLAFASEREALEAFARSFPDGTTLLVDTYDTVEGARTAVEVVQALAGEAAGGGGGGEGDDGDDGFRLGGVRLDSGDLAQLSREVRDLLDEAGLDDVDLFASGGLDEHRIADLVAAGAPIDAFGVGTALVVSRDAPSLDMSYKLAAYEGEPVMKLSTGKVTLPGLKQVLRRTDGEGTLEGDVLATWDEAEAGEVEGEPVLAEVDPDDPAHRDPAALHAARDRFADEFARLPDDVKVLEAPAEYPVERSAGLEALVQEAKP